MRLDGDAIVRAAEGALAEVLRERDELQANLATAVEELGASRRDLERSHGVLRRLAEACYEPGVGCRRCGRRSNHLPNCEVAAAEREIAGGAG